MFILKYNSQKSINILFRLGTMYKVNALPDEEKTKT